jgi:tRNA pseudouridine13 synthase
MPQSLALVPPLVTADLPGLGGRIKVFPEDFEVDEIPAYEPSGSGDFLYLWIEKRDLGAEYFVRQIAKRLDIPIGAVGSAGLKDRRAVTRQMISVPADIEDRLPSLEGEGVKLLRVSRHGNKLRPGHLHGNRFRILIRDLGPDVPALPTVSALLKRLQEHGLANFYGSQRFGRDAETWRLGLGLLQPESVEGVAQKKIRNPFLKKLALSAVQSGLFNHYLARRLLDGFARTVLLGDVMAKVPFGGIFVARDVAVEQQRFDAREIVPAGPIYGRKTFPAAEEAALREQATLAAFGLGREHFLAFGKLLQGTRRHNLVYLKDLTAVLEPDGLRLTFTLPAGSYATVLLRELMKKDVEDLE